MRQQKTVDSILLIRIDVHLAMFTIELKLELASIVQSEEERFAPVGLLVLLFACSQFIVYAMATLHKQWFVEMFL